MINHSMPKIGAKERERERESMCVREEIQSVCMCDEERAERVRKTV